MFPQWIKKGPRFPGLWPTSRFLFLRIGSRKCLAVFSSDEYLSCRFSMLQHENRLLSRFEKLGTPIGLSAKKLYSIFILHIAYRDINTLKHP